MGTVWRLTIDILPDYETSYAFFRDEVMKKLIKRFGLLSNVCTIIERDLPRAEFKKEDAAKEGLYCEFDIDPEFKIGKVTRLYVESDFDGAYGLGEVVFDIFKEACDRWMKDGSKITVSSWEDAGGEMTYVKGEKNDQD